MTKEMILELLKSYTMKTRVYGFMSDIIPDTEFDDLAENILLLIAEAKEADKKGVYNKG